MTYRRDNTELVPRRTPRRSSSQLMTSQWKPTTTTKSTLLTVLFVFSKFHARLRVRGSALRLATAPEFFLLFLHARILFVYSGLLK